MARHKRTHNALRVGEITLTRLSTFAEAWIFTCHVETGHAGQWTFRVDAYQEAAMRQQESGERTGKAQKTLDIPAIGEFHTGNDPSQAPGVKDERKRLLA